MKHSLGIPQQLSRLLVLGVLLTAFLVPNNAFANLQAVGTPDMDQNEGITTPEFPAAYQLFKLVDQEVFQASSQQANTKMVPEKLQVGLYILRMQQGEKSRKVRLVKEWLW